MPKILFMPFSNALRDVAPEPTPVVPQIPDWYHKQNPIIGNVTSPTNGQFPLTVKKCQAMFDAMTCGYVLKTPCDIYINTMNDNVDVQFPQHLKDVEHILLSSHPSEQITHLPIDHNLYLPALLRIHPLWLVKTEDGYSSLFTAPMHSEVLPLTAVPGIIDTDKFYSDGHLSFYVKKNVEGIIKRGTPLVQVIPFKREEWEHELIDVDEDGLVRQRALTRSMFQNGYRKLFWTKKNYK